MPAAFRKLDTIAVLTGPLLPAPREGRQLVIVAPVRECPANGGTAVGSAGRCPLTCGDGRYGAPGLRKSDSPDLGDLCPSGAAALERRCRGS